MSVQIKNAARDKEWEKEASKLANRGQMNEECQRLYERLTN